MNISIRVHEPGCRGCGLCVEVCPTGVLALEPERRTTTVKAVEDCIGCLSCCYVCPGNALHHSGVALVKNFFRHPEHVDRLGRFL